MSGWKEQEWPLFICFPSTGIEGEDLAAWRKTRDCVRGRDREKERVCQRVWVCATDKFIQTRVLYVYGWARLHLKGTSLWILRSHAQRTITALPRAGNIIKGPVQSNVSDIKLYDMSFSTFIFYDPTLILSALLIFVVRFLHSKPRRAVCTQSGKSKASNPRQAGSLPGAREGRVHVRGSCRANSTV